MDIARVRSRAAASSSSDAPAFFNATMSLSGPSQSGANTVAEHLPLGHPLHRRPDGESLDVAGGPCLHGTR